MSTEAWRRCSSCKTDIAFRATYWVCNVSTCNRKRTGLFFCSVSCWEAHLPTMRHRESWAVEKTAPGQAQRELEQAAETTTSAQRPQSERKAIAHADASVPSGSSEPLPMDVLVVASKVKKYIRAKSGMRCSDSSLDALSQIVRDACNEAIRRAGADGRQTVMDRDFRHY